MKKTKRRIGHDAIPHFCQIELTYACNADCIFCYNPENILVRDFEKTDRIVESIAKSQIPHVYLFGGEPSLFPVKKLNEYIEILSHHSSVTIVTNGIIKMEGISSKLACFGVPLHGATSRTHEFLNRRRGSFQKTIETIKYYVKEGHDVRCIPVLTSYNYGEIYEIIKLAAQLGMESIYVDRYEDGGRGASNSSEYKLKPSLEQFKEAVSQMIRAKNDFTSLMGLVGFGTAIPFCLDDRLDKEGLNSTCGAGTTFCAISPSGDLRLCNQSQLVFGNVLEDPIETIWNRESLDEFRDLSWVIEPCASCQLLSKCMCGCKVDINCSDKFCIDYAVRENKKPLALPKMHKASPKFNYPKEYRFFEVNPYLKLTTKYPQKFIVTRYQTVKTDKITIEILEKILQEKIISEEEFVHHFSDKIDEHEMRILLSKLLQISAIKDIESVDFQANKLQDLYKELSILYEGIQECCLDCKENDCMGYIWLLESEARSLCNTGVPIVQLNDGPNFIHSFPKDKFGKIDLSTRYPRCNYVGESGRSCLIRKDRPLVCRLYPIGLETTKEKEIVWAVHLDCLYVKKINQENLIGKLENDFLAILKRTSPQLISQIIETYKKVDEISISPYGSNNYKIIKGGV